MSQRLAALSLLASLALSTAVTSARASTCSVDLTANPDTITVGETSTLGFSQNSSADLIPLGCTIPSGAFSCGVNAWCVSPPVTMTYSTVCQWRQGGSQQPVCWANDTATVTVLTAPPPPSTTFKLDRELIVETDSATLTWTVTNAKTCAASSSPASTDWTGSIPATSGAKVVHPTKTTLYTLTCSGAGGTVSKQRTVQVFGQPVNLGSGINRSGDEMAVSINRAAPNTSILFASRPVGGNADLYYAVLDPTMDRWSTPTALPAPVNSAYQENSVTDAIHLIFGGWRPPVTTNTDLWETSSVGGVWSNPTNLASVNTSSNETSPFLTAHEDKLLFASDRPGGLGSYDLYQAVPTAGGWGNVTSLGSTINSGGSDISPFISKDGTILFFSSSRAGSFDIYYSKQDSTGAWRAPVAFGAPINTTSAEQYPALSDDGTRLYFISNRPGGYGGLDIYVSIKQ